jgi:hypothetical protein
MIGKEAGSAGWLRPFAAAEGATDRTIAAAPDAIERRTNFGPQSLHD